MDSAPSPLAEIALADADATADLARRFAPLLRAGDALLLEGPIGAGKSHLSRALIRARLDREEDVPSPTFTLVQTYGDDPEIWHADLYRLGHPDEALELGLDEAFETAICLVEWPERLGSLRPADALTLRFEQTRDGRSRRVSLSGGGAWPARLGGLRP